MCIGDGDVLRREDGHVLRRTLYFEVEGQRKKGMLGMTWKKHDEEGLMLIRLPQCRVNLATLTCFENTGI